MTNPAPVARFIHGTNVDESVFERNVRSALEKVKQGPILIAAGGPSLKQFPVDQARRNADTFWCLNNSWRQFDRVVIHAVVLMDARPEMVKFCDPVGRIAEWLVASQCDPSVLDKLSGPCADVTIWHAAGPKIIDQLGLHGIRGGGTVLSRAINLAWERGFRDFTLAGVDSSITAEAHHAYPQAINDNDKRIEVETPKGARFITTPELAEQATTVFRQMREYEKIGGSFRIIADGLLPTLWAEFKADFPNGEPKNV